jgi:hypothetical protein
MSSFALMDKVSHLVFQKLSRWEEEEIVLKELNLLQFFSSTTMVKIRNQEEKQLSGLKIH